MIYLNTTEGGEINLRFVGGVGSSGAICGGGRVIGDRVISNQWGGRVRRLVRTGDATGAEDWVHRIALHDQYLKSGNLT